MGPGSDNASLGNETAGPINYILWLEGQETLLENMKANSIMHRNVGVELYFVRIFHFVYTHLYEINR